MELVNFTAFNAHATGTSFLSAEQGVKSITLTTIEDVASYITDLLKGFYSERTGNWSRWTYISQSDLNWHVHTQSLDYEDNLWAIKHYIKEDGSWSFSGGLPHKYEVEVTKKDSLFVVSVKTFIHMTISSDLFSWFTEDMMKQALIKKIEYINDSKNF